MKSWTRAEENLLRENSHKPLSELIKLLGRSEGSIRAKARRLGIKLERVVVKPHWSDKDVDLLRRYYATRSKEGLQKLFPDKSWRSIQHKATRLKVYRAPVKHYLRPQRIGTLSRDDKLYLAGLLDGEGTITISIGKRKAKPEIGGSPVTPLITITNSCKELIDWLKSKLFGCTIKTGKATKVRKAVWTIQVARLLDVKALLEQVTPHLKAKRRQAELLLEFCNLRLKGKWAEYDPKLFEIAKEIRRLNKKGPNESKRALLTNPLSLSSLFFLFMSLNHAESEKTFLRNRRVFIAELFGKSLGERRIDVCWFCGGLFTEDEAEYHELCDTWRCPHCGKCFCDLPPTAQRVLDREMFSLGLWNPYVNPRKRKKRGGRIVRGATREDFMEFASCYYPSLVDRYKRGEISFDELKREVEKDVGLAWVF